MDTSSRPMAYVAAATFVVALTSIIYFGKVSNRDQVSMTSEIRELESRVSILRTEVKELSQQLDTLNGSVAATTESTRLIANRLPEGTSVLLTRRDLDNVVAKERQRTAQDLAKLQSTIAQLQRASSARNPPKDGQ